MPVPDSSPSKPILVTGAPRCGTTWVGHILAQAQRVAYIHEPLNVDHDPGICRTDFKYTFPYICERNERRYLAPLTATLQLRYETFRALLHARNLKQLRLVWQKTFEFQRHRRAGSRPLIKDPLAAFSADWLSRRFGMTTVVMVRHPAGFARSYMAKGWTHPFADFLAQPLLLEHRLSEFADDIRLFAEHEQPVIDQAALLWKLIYAELSAMKSRHPEWVFVRYEDLCIDPARGFEKLFAAVGLEFSNRIRGVLRNSSQPDDTALPPGHSSLPPNLYKDSRTVATAWKEEISARDILRLKNRVSPIWQRFYADSEW